jgi:predicted lysophospholipase L1 biosynthesis ABC-type transport system permease subunit
MTNWLKRFQERQRELAQGVDADLVKANRSRFRRGLFLLAFGCLLGLVGPKMHLSLVLRAVTAVVFGVSCLIGLFMLQWAARESAFLNSPESEKPLSILNNDDR